MRRNKLFTPKQCWLAWRNKSFSPTARRRRKSRSRERLRLESEKPCTPVRRSTALEFAPRLQWERRTKLRSFKCPTSFCRLSRPFPQWPISKIYNSRDNGQWLRPSRIRILLGSARVFAAILLVEMDWLYYVSAEYPMLAAAFLLYLIPTHLFAFAAFTSAAQRSDASDRYYTE